MLGGGATAAAAVAALAHLCSGVVEVFVRTPERAAELVQRAGSGVPKALLARDYGISRETVYQYLRHAKIV